MRTITKTLEEMAKIIEAQNNLIRKLGLELAEKEELIEELMKG